MKKLISSPLLVICLLVLLQIFCHLSAVAQNAHHPEDHDYGCPHNNLVSAQNQKTPPAWGTVESHTSALNSPSIAMVFDPSEGGQLLYETVAGWTAGETDKAQLSVKIWVKNLLPDDLTWTKVVYQYAQGNSNYTRTFILNLNPIEPDEWKSWQNGRDYHEVGDVLYFDAPIPNSLTIKLYFAGYPDPVVVTKPLAPYDETFGMPFRAFDLGSNEVWEGGSTHGGGSQVFAYDLKVVGLNNGTWSSLLPNTDGSENEHSRVWGKPIYAMADGVVKEFVNNVPNNPAPWEEADWGDYTNGAGGNHFYIQHGDHMALYAHMQLGSLNPGLMQIGKAVKAGDFLGLAGNSGNSTGPHLHIHVRKETSIETGPFRPLLFHTGFAISKTEFTTLNSTSDWTPLTEHGLPGYAGTRAFIWPSSVKPLYNSNTYTSVFRTGNDAHAMLSGMSIPVLLQKDMLYKNSGFRMTDMSVTKVGDNLEYSAVWRAGTGASKVQPGVSWATFYNEFNSLSNQGYRLLDLEVFTDAGGALKYAGVYGAGNWGHYLFVGLTQAAFNAKWSEYGNLGYRLVDVEVYKSNGVTLYAGVFKAGGGGYALWHAGNWASFVSQWQDLNALGYRLVDLDTEGTGNSTIYSGTFLAGNDGYLLWQSNWNSTRSYWEHVSDRGYRLVDFNVRPVSGAGTLGVADEDDLTGDLEDLLLVGPAISDRFEQTTAKGNLKVAPNPASDRFIVNAGADIQAWTLYNSSGKIVLQETAGSAVQDLSIEVGALPSGVYFLSVRTAGGIETQRVEVVR